MTYDEFLMAIANGEQRDDGRTLAVPQIRHDLRDGLPISVEEQFQAMKDGLMGDGRQLDSLWEDMATLTLAQPRAVTPSEDAPWAVYVHADESLSLSVSFDSIEATDELTAAMGRYGLLLLAIAAAKRRQPNTLIISAIEANVYAGNLEKLKTPPALVPVAIGPIGRGVAGMLAMGFGDVRVGRSDAA